MSWPILNKVWKVFGRLSVLIQPQMKV